ncbi:MAG: acetate/propionate family kinase [Phycisphaerales bacterium]|nr:acetate/propionate family kinase [Phycisphaerales bacterium]
MAEAILILNAGSSSLKFSVFSVADQLNLLIRGQIEGLLNSPTFRAFDARGQLVDEKSWEASRRFGHADAIEVLLKWLKEASGGHRLVAAGHRVVHGGTEFAHPVRIDARVVRELKALVPFAPLHQPHNLAVIAAVARLAPHLPQVACFDTSFHSTQPAIAQAFALPRVYSEAGVRRYGFHGLSYEYIADVLPRVDPAAAAGRAIVAHLGNGASLCAMRGGKSIATTMSFTALDGLVMGTCCGAIDPGVVLYLNQHAGLSFDEIQRLLYEQSGLLGVSGISGDMRTLLASDDPRAKDAIDLFIYRAAREIGSLAAALGGLDAIVFTGGIGENATAIRAAICQACQWLGVELDNASNARGGPQINRPNARVTAWVLPTNEELMIARHTVSVLAQSFDQVSRK